MFAKVLATILVVSLALGLITSICYGISETHFIKEYALALLFCLSSIGLTSILVGLFYLIWTDSKKEN
jgi:hypothetical protein